MSTYSLAGFAAKMAEVAVKSQIEGRRALEKAARLVEHEAKASIGNYQAAAGPFVAWDELADSTKADRISQGYTENDPELRDGTMRDSIEHTVTMDELHGEAEIGSNDPVLGYQELGTAKMPPRSILGGALVRKSDQVVEIIGGSVFAALTGDEVHQGAIPLIGQ